MATVRFAVCNEMFQGWEIADVFRFCAELGYDGVELQPSTIAPSIFALSQERRKAIAQAAKRDGITVAGFHWLLTSPPGLHVNHPDPAIRSRTVTYLEALIRACAELGGEVLVFGSPEQREILPPLSREEGVELSLEAFAACGRAAEEAGVFFCLEPLTGSGFISSVAEAVDLVRQVGSPGLRLMVDVKSMCREQLPIPDLVRMAAPYLKHLHANDENPTGGPALGPGMGGTTDFVPLFRALNEVGFEGYVSVEAFDWSLGPEEVARQSLHALRLSAELAR
jgi:sugar phosphate isomerase/epimerase